MVWTDPPLSQVTKKLVQPGLSREALSLYLSGCPTTTDLAYDKAWESPEQAQTPT